MSTTFEIHSGYWHSQTKPTSTTSAPLQSLLQPSRVPYVAYFGWLACVQSLRSANAPLPWVQCRACRRWRRAGIPIRA